MAMLNNHHINNILNHQPEPHTPQQLRLQQCHPVAWPHATDSRVAPWTCALGKHNSFHTMAYIYIYICPWKQQQLYYIYIQNLQKRTNELHRAKLGKQEQTWASICKIERTQRQINTKKRKTKSRNEHEQKYSKGKNKPGRGKKQTWAKKSQRRQTWAEKWTKKNQKERTIVKKKQKRSDKKNKQEPTRAQMGRNDQFFCFLFLFFFFSFFLHPWEPIHIRNPPPHTTHTHFPWWTMALSSNTGWTPMRDIKRAPAESWMVPCWEIYVLCIFMYPIPFPQF